jgi:hypothetical protein
MNDIIRNTAATLAAATQAATEHSFSRAAHVNIFSRGPHTVFIPPVTRQAVTDGYVIGRTAGDNLPVFLLRAVTMVQEIDLLMTSKGEVLSIDNEPVKPIFFSQSIRGLKSLAPKDSPRYRHYAPA